MNFRIKGLFPMDSVSMERRKYERYETPYTALYCQYNNIRAVRINDISKSGAAIVFKDDIEVRPGYTATLHFYSRDTNSLVARLECKVIRKFDINGQTAIGIQFETSNKAINSIIEFLEKQNV